MRDVDPWDLKRHPEDFFQLAESGIFVPYADAFEYEKSGVMLIGYPQSGKTSISGRFVGYNNRYNNKKAKRLSKDTSLNRLEEHDTHIYSTGNVLSVDVESVVEKNDRYPLVAIFYVHKLYDDKGCNDLEFALDMMFGEIWRERSGILYGAYENIPLLNLPRYENPNLRYRALKREIKDILDKK